MHCPCRLPSLRHVTASDHGGPEWLETPGALSLSRRLCCHGIGAVPAFAEGYTVPGLLASITVTRRTSLQPWEADTVIVSTPQKRTEKWPCQGRTTTKGQRGDPPPAACSSTAAPSHHWPLVGEEAEGLRGHTTAEAAHSCFTFRRHI